MWASSNKYGTETRNVPLNNRKRSIIYTFHPVQDIAAQMTIAVSSVCRSDYGVLGLTLASVCLTIGKQLSPNSCT
ncbi:hypothetical protein CEXT_763561 [Caerostris extrusa]|uniref:Uncharacterized protein n=1 Tax=Caerostris extrusa TaxID=172846 RepID=A0AAV4UAU7_CAEEX|nr:hypothetical protein CEXT_763561 [Caerostris extrusa]